MCGVEDCAPESSRSSRVPTAGLGATVAFRRLGHVGGLELNITFEYFT